MKKQINSIASFLNQGFKSHLQIVIPILFLLFISAFMIMHGMFLSPDKFFVAVLLLMIIMGRAKEFVKDWSPLVMLLLSYEYLRGLVPAMNSHPYVYPMIKIDEALFGYLPTLKLQSLFFNPKTVHIYDYIATILYLSHFVVPLTISLYFWLKDKQMFRSYTVGMLVLSYLAYFTYLVFPAMPPWMASQIGYIPHVQKIFDQTVSHFSNYINMPSVYNVIGVNLVAAVPSLHAAYPTLTLLFLYNRVGKFKPVLFLYAFSMYFSVVYLGEHYVIDVILGIIYALFTFIIFSHKGQILKYISSIFNKLTSRYIFAQTTDS